MLAETLAPSQLGEEENVFSTNVGWLGGVPGMGLLLLRRKILQMPVTFRDKMVWLPPEAKMLWF